MRCSIVVWVVAAVGCVGGGDEEDEVKLPDVTEATFVLGVTNPWMPMPVGATWSYESDTDEGVQRVETVVLPDTKVIQGVTATVVQDQEFLDDVLVEDTDDWFAQDTEGNVWYLGEDTCEIENGVCGDTEGSWTWGVDGALPGILMPGDPQVDGQPYYQEFYVGHAEDVGEILEVGLTADVPAGQFTDCVRTRDTSTLDLDVEEFKTYCDGVGLVREEEDDATSELQATTGL